LPVAAYESIFTGRATFRRDVWVDRRWLGYWHFVVGENADHVVRGWLERQFGPDAYRQRTVTVGDRDSANPRMWDSFPGFEKPHDVP